MKKLVGFSKCLVKIKDCILVFNNINAITYDFIEEDDDVCKCGYFSEFTDEPLDHHLQCVIETKPENAFVELDEFLLCLVFDEKCVVFPKCKNKNGRIFAERSLIGDAVTSVFYMPKKELYKYTCIDLAKIEEDKEKQIQQKQHIEVKEKCHIMIVDHNITIDEFIEHLEKIKNKVGGEVEIGQVFKIGKQ